MKFCGMCGAQMPDEAVTCTNCGAPLQASQVPQQPYQQQDFQQQPYQQQPYQQQPYQQQPYQQQPYQQMGYQQQGYYAPQTTGSYPGKGKAIAALVCGIVGLVFSCFAGLTVSISAFIGLVVSIIGIVFGIQGRNACQPGMPGRGMATGGFVCAIIGTVFSGIVALSCGICYCVMCANGVDICAATSAASSYNNYDWYTILFM